MVSIEEVRDLLRQDREPDTEVRDVPLAIPVPAGASMVLASAAQIEAQRAARWSETPVMASARVKTNPLLRQRVAIAASVAGIAVGLLLALALSGPDVPPEVEAQLDAQAATITGLEADLAATQDDAWSARSEVLSLAAERDELRDAVVTLETAAAAKPAKKKTKRRRSARRDDRRNVARRPVKRRRRPVKLSRSDKKLDALMDAL